MQSTRALKNLDVSRISTFLAECKQPFQTSHLYDAVENKKLVDTERRLSEFRSITDERLFDLAEDIVKQLSAQDESADFTLVRNDLTHIRYHTGGFFKKHEDYLSVTSNLVEEYTLLLCVTPAGMHTVGGETVIFGHNGSQVRLKLSSIYLPPPMTVPFHCIRRTRRRRLAATPSSSARM